LFKKHQLPVQSQLRRSTATIALSGLFLIVEPIGERLIALCCVATLAQDAEISCGVTRPVVITAWWLVMFDLNIAFVIEWMTATRTESFRRHHGTQQRHKRPPTHINPEKFFSDSELIRPGCGTPIEDFTRAVCILFLVP